MGKHLFKINVTTHFQLFSRELCLTPTPLLYMLKPVDNHKISLHKNTN